MSATCISNGLVLARTSQYAQSRSTVQAQSAFVTKSFRQTTASLTKSSFVPVTHSVFDSLNAPTRSHNSLSLVVQVVAEGEGPEASKVFVGNINWETQSEDLRELFSGYGDVQTADVIIDGATGRSRGFAFVTMGSPAEATAAIEGLNQTEVGGRTLKVDKVLGPGERPEPRERAPRRNNDNPFRLYVGNLPWRFDDYDLEDAFQEFGEMQEARIIYDRDTGRSRGFGFVTLNSEEDVENAVKTLDGAEIDGRAIRVNRAEQKSS
mmetsp:Transcript_29688/g.40997  ORF Transcript_29688/g.40997 Transcript_29688/m.40997 type:complete len:265 (+) Transcript_29688:106-900(+)|eukprot:CAMPEP_0196575206 /NCGR_PEP_ID=MMETSP1081-20130531/4723_1 /TAXON_ID=36882 /ORGANISM="Pyramimonas amylifera, Strain CCMP720" /LENGTH=264 /DNA_ID=CAMNT_0041893427 /DNA_START=105 /DNA_END=899 /DNA_ORIENTATION=-